MNTFLKISAVSLLIPSFYAAAAPFTTPARAAGMPSQCESDPLIKTDDAVYRTSWAFRCGLLDKATWSANHPNPAPKALYPLFARAAAPYTVFKPDVSSCQIPSDVTFYEVCENGFPIFSGRSQDFGSGLAWDDHGSSVTPLESGKTIRFNLNNDKNQVWGASAYVFKSNYSYVNLGPYSRLHLKIKNSGYGASLRILVYLVDMDGHAESLRLPLKINRTYNNYILDLDQISLNGFNTSQTQAIVIATSELENRKFEVDIEKISAD